jgi:hypothetical protein
LLRYTCTCRNRFLFFFFFQNVRFFFHIFNLNLKVSSCQNSPLIILFDNPLRCSLILAHQHKNWFFFWRFVATSRGKKCHGWWCHKDR